VFTDGTAQLTPELWDPASEQFSKLAPGTVPRTYHRCTLVGVTTQLTSDRQAVGALQHGA
jgi:hypothetical protein